MILSPIENLSAKKGTVWTQARPVLTQGFGGNPHIYRQFGLKGHNGIDFRAPVGTPVFAPFDGETQPGDQGMDGYGLHIKLRSREKGMEAVFGHLSRLFPGLKKQVKQGDPLGYTGNSGFSSGPHLHFGVRRLVPHSGNSLWAWQVIDAGNGYAGYFDISPFLITWKGTLLRNSLAE